MQFLYPNFLYALLLLVIPVIIHLFFFKRFKKVYFPSITFLKEVKEEKNASQKIKNFLVLLTRLFALAALVFAFAQPFWKTNDSVEMNSNVASIYIDNSFSMNALSDDVPLVEMAKQKARELVNGFSDSDLFHIVTNDFEGKRQRLVSKKDALGFIEEIKPTPTVRDIEKILLQQKSILSKKNDVNKQSFLISDFQKNICSFPESVDSLSNIQLIPLESVSKNNVGVDSVWFSAPAQVIGQVNELIVQISNKSKQDNGDIRVTLNMNGIEIPAGTLSIKAGETKFDTVSVTIRENGWHQSFVKIEDYPIQFDDKYFFTFNVSPEVKILVINDLEPNKYIQNAFSGLSFFKITNQNNKNINYSQFYDYQLIILNELPLFSTGLTKEIQDYIQQGGNCLVFPAPNADLVSYNLLLHNVGSNELQSFENQTRKVANINTKEFLFNNVFNTTGNKMQLPVTQGNFKLSHFVNRSEEKILSYRDGTPFLAKSTFGNGKLYLSSAPLQSKYSDLTASAEIFVPMLYRMAIASGDNTKIAYFIGKDAYIEQDVSGTAGDLIYKISSTFGEFIPEQRNFGSKVIFGMKNQVKNAGFYVLNRNNKKDISKFAFNYDRKESDLDFYDLNELKNILPSGMKIIENADKENLTDFVSSAENGKFLWWWFIVFALVFLGIETLLLRFWKT